MDTTYTLPPSSGRTTMLPVLVLTLVASQGLTGSAYVVLEENGYYSTWRGNQLGPQATQWPGFLNPQLYFPFMQNLNPFGWGQPPQPSQRENLELDVIRDRQTALFNLIRCLLEQRKDVCRKMLANVLVFFQDVPELAVNTPAATVFQLKSPRVTSTVVQVVPEAELLEESSETVPVTIRPSSEHLKEEVVPKKMEVKSVDSNIDPSASLLRPQEAPTDVNLQDRIKSQQQTDNPLVMETQPLEARPIKTEFVGEQSNPVEAESSVLQVKPVEIEPTVAP